MNIIPRFGLFFNFILIGPFVIVFVASLYCFMSYQFMSPVHDRFISLLRLAMLVDIFILLVVMSGSYVVFAAKIKSVLYYLIALVPLSSLFIYLIFLVKLGGGDPHMQILLLLLLLPLVMIGVSKIFANCGVTPIWWMRSQYISLSIVCVLSIFIWDISIYLLPVGK